VGRPARKGGAPLAVGAGDVSADGGNVGGANVGPGLVGRGVAGGDGGGCVGCWVGTGALVRLDEGVGLALGFGGGLALTTIVPLAEPAPSLAVTR